MSYLRPEEVFTPRNPLVNDDMYVHREQLETALYIGLDSHYQLVIYGESGCGKSWLYKKILRDSEIPYVIADCSNARRLKSLSAEFKNIVNRSRTTTKVSYEEEKKAGIKIPVAEGGLSHKDKYDIVQPEPYEELLQLLSSQSNGRQSVLVLDNLEKIIDKEEIVDELGSLITLADNPDYAQYNVKLLIVGVPRDLRTIFLRVADQATIGNRLQELPEVTGLTPRQVESLFYKGFEDQLDIHYPTSIAEILIKQLNDYTAGIPQRVHELCLQLALLQVDNPDTNPLLLMEWAVVYWIRDSLSLFRANIEAVMNDRSTQVGRRNQVIFALGKLQQDLFTVTDVEDLLRTNFPVSTKGRALGVSQVLSDLSKVENPIITNKGKSRAYNFTDRRYQMCIKGLLAMDTTTERVYIRDIHKG